MSARDCRVVQITAENLFTHENADSLVIFRHDGIQVVIRKESWKLGDFALWCPPDSVVPDRPEWAWAAGRVKVAKLRGVISEGVLLPIQEDEARQAQESGNILDYFHIDHYEPPVSLGQGQAETPPKGYYPHYDVEGAKTIQEMVGKEVVVTEKLHGQNICVTFDGDKFHVRSRSIWKKDEGDCIFWQSVRNTAGLLDLARNHPNMVFYGEQVGHVKHFKYGQSKPRVFLFDVFDLDTKRWLDYTEFSGVVPAEMAVPVEYVGVFSEQHCRELAESPGNFQPLREGVVVKPVADTSFDRPMTKFINPAYFQKS